MRISDYVDATAERQPNRPALIQGDVEIEYSQAQSIIHSAAHALEAENGLGKSSHIAIYAPNDYRVPLLLLAINRADMVWLSVHTRNPIEINLEILSFLDCEFVFFHSAYEEVVPKLKSRLEKIKGFVCIDRASEHGPSLAEWSADHDRPYKAQPEDPLGPCVLQPTGGTTGPSKAALHTHRGLEISVLAGREAQGLDPKVRFLAAAPLTHAGGMSALHTLTWGGCCIVVNITEPQQILEAIQRWRITHVFLPPTVIYTLMEMPETQQTDLSSLRCLGTGGAPFAPEKAKRATRLFGPVLYEGYGQTECLMPLTVKRPEDYLLPDGDFDETALRSAGRAVSMVRMEIMDKTGRLLPPGETGEIVVQSSMVMREYYKNPEETKTSGAYGWQHTGDVGVKDERGFITIVDRIKDMIVSGGFNVFPNQIEAVILENEAVLDCAVIGVPDEKWGEAVKAVIQLKPGQQLAEDTVIAACRERLGGVYAPKSVEFWEELPRSAVGKVLRRTVRDRFWKEQWRAV